MEYCRYRSLLLQFTLSCTSMFTLAILIGLYAYTIFSMGIFHALYTPNILIINTLYVIISIFLLHKHVLKQKPQSLSKFETAIILIIFLQLGINCIGTLGPELAFDALWYHLTLPKLFITLHRITYIPGGLLYYSTMPKLIEMLYIPALIFSNEIAAKTIHFVFGIVTIFAIYSLSRKVLNRTYSLFAVLIFTSNLVFAWEMTTAYIDLGRTFFELMALYGFINYFKEHKKKWIVITAVLLGFAVSTKLLAIGSIAVFIIVYLALNKRQFKHLTFLLIVPLIIAAPWFIFSFISTGNPVFPFFTPIYKTDASLSLLNPFKFLRDIFILFTSADDPVSSLYLVLLPLAVSVYHSLKKPLKIIFLYCILTLCVWYVTPRTGGGRFILPYLPAFSIAAAATIQYVKSTVLKKYLLGTVFLIALTTLFYRALANKRYIPVLLGKETKQEFLCRNLNFNFGDFYDCDNYFKTHIKKTDTVLIYGVHNLFYIKFPFVHASYLDKNHKYNYVLIQGDAIPKEFMNRKPIYTNKQTNVRLYAL